MISKEKKHEYYLAHREKMLSQTKNYQATHKNHVAAVRKVYLEKNKERIAKRHHDYYIKKGMINYGVKANGRHKPTIFGVNKAPFPDDGRCPSCGMKSRLNWHHWSDDNPDDGLWLCVGCHTVLHRLIKYPGLQGVVREKLLSELKARRPKIARA